MQAAATSQREQERELTQGGRTSGEARLANEFKIKQLRLVWSARQFLYRTVAIGFLVSTLAVFLIPRSFESTARLMPPDNRAGLGMALVGALSHSSGVDLGSVVSGLMESKSQGALFIGVLRSRSVQDQLIDKFNLQAVYGKRYREDARQKLEDKTQIAEDRKNGIITITVTDHSPQRAAAIADEYVNSLNRTVSQLSTSSAHKERLFLEQRLDSAAKDLEAAERDFGQFASMNATLDISEQGKAMVEADAVLQGKIIAAKSQLEGLERIFTDENVRVRAAKARIAEMESQLKRLSGDRGNDRNNAGLQYPSLRQLPLLGSTYGDKFRNLKIQEAVYETLSKQYELVKVQEAKELPTIKLLDFPKVPEKKSFPPRLVMICAGTIVAACLGVFWVLASARLLEYEPGDPRKVLAQRVLRGALLPFPMDSGNGKQDELTTDEYPVTGARGEGAEKS
jgi:capsule polysaccharide export protein KpsE/RkpR